MFLFSSESGLSSSWITRSNKSLPHAMRTVPACTELLLQHLHNPLVSLKRWIKQLKNCHRSKARQIVIYLTE
jgi:hypothetical protein